MKVSPLGRWVEPEQAANFNACQARLAWAVNTQRARYPAIDQQSRCQAFPALFTNSRRYCVAEEIQQWNMTHVFSYLAQFRFQRKVEKYGQLTLFANTYSVGRRYARHYVEIQLDALTQEWVIRDEYAHELCRHPNRELTYAQISQLRLGKRRRIVTT